MGIAFKIVPFRIIQGQLCIYINLVRKYRFFINRGDFIIFDVVGWIGMILGLLAYALFSSNKIENGKLYQTLNFGAATLMAIGLIPTGACFFNIVNYMGVDCYCFYY